MLETAIYAVREAEKIVMSYYNREKGIKNKGEFDLVTRADLESEKKILSILKEKFPDHGFIMEEQKNINENAEYVWVIDPIDGTTSFSHNYPMFSISVALLKNKEPILGVVSAPYLIELFYAEKGRGSFLNNKKISVSRTDSIKKSLIATGFPYKHRKQNLGYLKNIADHVQGMRRSGSAALDVCYVAAGRLDGYWEIGLKKVDTAAAQLILEEAGGKVTDIQGNEIKEDYSKIVATNKIIHKEIVSLLNKKTKGE